MDNANILVVDDELGIRLFLEETLKGDGHQVVAVESGEKAITLASTTVFDLVLLDLNMAGIGGMDVLAFLKEHSPDTVVIILTAHATLETAVEALRQGAHDYLFKPCKTVKLRDSIQKGLLNRQQELQRRQLLEEIEDRLETDLQNIRATIGPVQKRSDRATESIRTNRIEERFCHFGGLIVDFSRHVITLDGALLELSPTEFDLLAYLISESPRVIPPQELVREVQGYESEPWEASETIRQHIRRLRQKINQATTRSNVIRTMRGVGYTIVD